MTNMKTIDEYMVKPSLTITEAGDISVGDLPDTSGLYLTKAAVLLEVLTQIPSVANGILDLTDKDTEDYARLGNIGRVVKIGPAAFGPRSPVEIDTKQLIGKYVLFNQYTGHQIMYKKQRLVLVDDFQILAVLENIEDIDRSFILKTF